MASVLGTAEDRAATSWSFWGAVVPRPVFIPLARIAVFFCSVELFHVFLVLKNALYSVETAHLCTTLRV